MKQLSDLPTATIRRLSVLLCTAMCCLFMVRNAWAQPFITTWKTDNPGSSSPTSITIPTRGNGYYYDVDWDNDGLYDQFGITGSVTHDYGKPGIVTIRIRGSFPRIYCRGSGDRTKLLSIDQWGSIAWASMSSAFWGAENLSCRAADVPDLSGVTDMSHMFDGASSFNGDLSRWDVSKVTDMSYMFAGASAFNGDLSRWEVSQVRNMAGMFSGARAFNGDLSKWDVSQVQDMSGMFARASVFNGDLSRWEVSQVKDMSRMFADARAFRGDLSRWEVGQVRDMSDMFSGALVFNSDLSRWDVSQVRDMSRMFALARAFKSDLSRWEVGQVRDMSYMFYSADVFNSDLSRWDVSQVRNMRSMFWGARSFSSDLSRWEVSEVTNMSGMFFEALAFNSDLSQWDVSQVRDMSYMFRSALAFNSDLSQWDVSQVRDMSWMFGLAIAFNSDLSQWDVRQVRDMSNMFRQASAFNQNLGSWNIGAVADMARMLDLSGLSVAHYDSTLMGWQSQGVRGLSLGAEGLKYCLADSARRVLLTRQGWTIRGDQKDCTPLGMETGQSRLSLEVYPDFSPAGVHFSLWHPPGEEVQLSLWDTSGRTLWSYELRAKAPPYQQSLVLPTAGVYILSARSRHRQLIRRLVVN